MEHRLDTRRDIRLDVVVQQAGSPAIVCQSRNASANGMFLEVGAAGSHLRCREAVTLDVSGRPGDARRRICAFLVHQHEDGVGVVFASSDPLGLLAGGARAGA